MKAKRNKKFFSIQKLEKNLLILTFYLSFIITIFMIVIFTKLHKKVM